MKKENISKSDKDLIENASLSDNNIPIRKGDDLKWPIVSITPFSLIDFPNIVSCILWFSGCNLRCRYCYNTDIVLNKLPHRDKSEIIDFLVRRRGYLEGVVLSGGECTIHRELLEIAQEVREIGYRLKLDTNGTNPEIISRSIDQGLFEYVAFDLKSTFKNYKNITGYNDTSKIKESLRLLIESKIQLEVRTTVHTDLIEEQEINEITEYLSHIGYHGDYYIQNFKYDHNLSNLKDQTRTLNLNNILSRPNINVRFRNYTT